MRHDRTRFCIFAAMSSVKSAVLPPAPQVMSQNVGPYAAMRSCLSNKFATPWAGGHLKGAEGEGARS